MEALRFECQPGCITCCDRYGFVYLTEDDLQKISAYVGMTTAAFEAKYVYRTKNQVRLRKPRVAECHFLLKRADGTGGCKVHAVKPVQCRTYPYWPELIEYPDVWEHEATRCPGINKGEKLIQIGAALEIAEEMKTAYPWSYDPVR